ncbi:MAG: ribosome-associated translation inhibitor RaiA [Sandaracinaceae bacterium]|nr:ribosome-associated translation inhibitor RaiA [Sandaracinaceae bacterium]
MQVHFTFRNVESSEGIKNYARDKITRMQKYLRSPLEADVILSKERHLHRVEMSVRADGERYAGTVESEDMYASIDLVIDKVDRQVREAKDSANARKRHSSPGLAHISPVPEGAHADEEEEES